MPPYVFMNRSTQPSVYSGSFDRRIRPCRFINALQGLAKLAEPLAIRIIQHTHDPDVRNRHAATRSLHRSTDITPTNGHERRIRRDAARRGRRDRRPPGALLLHPSMAARRRRGLARENQLRLEGASAASWVGRASGRTDESGRGGGGGSSTTEPSASG